MSEAFKYYSERIQALMMKYIKMCTLAGDSGVVEDAPIREQANFYYKKMMDIDPYIEEEFYVYRALIRLLNHGSISKNKPDRKNYHSIVNADGSSIYYWHDDEP